MRHENEHLWTLGHKKNTLRGRIGRVGAASSDVEAVETSTLKCHLFACAVHWGMGRWSSIRECCPSLRLLCALHRLPVQRDWCFRSVSPQRPGAPWEAAGCTSWIVSLCLQRRTCLDLSFCVVLHKGLSVWLHTQQVWLLLLHCHLVTERTKQLLLCRKGWPLKLHFSNVACWAVEDMALCLLCVFVGFSCMALTNFVRFNLEQLQCTTRVHLICTLRHMIGTVQLNCWHIKGKRLHGEVLTLTTGSVDCQSKVLHMPLASPVCWGFFSQFTTFRNLCMKIPHERHLSSLTTQKKYTIRMHVFAHPFFSLTSLLFAGFTQQGGYIQRGL